MDPSIKDPQVKLTLKSWGFYLDMPYDSLVRAIIIAMTLIAVVLMVPRMSWSLAVSLECSLSLGSSKSLWLWCWFLRGTSLWGFLWLSLECSFSLDHLSCKVYIDSTLPKRFLIWMDMLLTSILISYNYSWMSIRTLLKFRSMMAMTSRLCTRRQSSTKTSPKTEITNNTCK